MNKKKIIMLLGSVCLALMLVAPMVVACAEETPAPTPKPAPTMTVTVTPTPTPSPTPEFKPVTLRYGEQGPPTGVRPEVEIWWADEVEKRTDGRVKIEFYWDQSIVKSKEMLRGVMTGAVDIALQNAAYYPSQMHTWGIFDTFVRGPKDPSVQRDLKMKCAEGIPAFSGELDQWNQKMLIPWNYTPIALGCTYPITKLSDMDGKKMRAASSWHMEMLEAAGATTVALRWSDCYSALQKGTVDGILNSVDSYYRYSTDEVAKNYLWSPRLWIGHNILTTINLDVWNSLLEQDRETILEISQEASDMEVEKNLAFIDQCITETTERNNAIWTEMSLEDVTKWQNMTRCLAMPDKWAEEATASGLPGEEIKNAVKAIIEEALAKE